MFAAIERAKQGLSRKLAQVPAKVFAPQNLCLSELATALFPAISRPAILLLESELLEDQEFHLAVNQRMLERRGRQAMWNAWRKFLYIAVRLLKPQAVLETGVFDGLSSAAILLGLHKNEEGHLTSIDLPAYATIEHSTNFMPDTTLPAGCEPGWVVPDWLRHRYTVHLGDSRQVLPRVLRELRSIDIFFHDSLHTFDHMYFEYSSAWPLLKEGGLLLSDDTTWNPAFYKFCKEKKRRYYRLGGFGAVMK